MTLFLIFTQPTVGDGKGISLLAWRDSAMWVAEKNHMYIIINYVCEMMQIEYCTKTEEFYYQRCRF